MSFANNEAGVSVYKLVKMRSHKLAIYTVWKAFEKFVYFMKNTNIFTFNQTMVIKIDHDFVVFLEPKKIHYFF